MKTNFLRRILRRRGFLLQETTMAILLVTAVMAATAQLLHGVTQQRRSEEYRALAVLETANVLEDLMARSWSELTAPDLRHDLSPLCRSRLPDARLRLSVEPESAADTRRIRVVIDWQSPTGQRSRAVQLVAWRTNVAEVSP